MFDVKVTCPKYEYNFVRYVVHYLYEHRGANRWKTSFRCIPCTGHLSPILRTHKPLQSKSEFRILNTQVLASSYIIHLYVHICTHTHITSCIRNFCLHICTPRHNLTAVSHALVFPHLHNQAQLYNCITHPCISTSVHPGTNLQLYHTHLYLHICTPRHKFTTVSHTLVSPHLHNQSQSLGM